MKLRSILLTVIAVFALQVCSFASEPVEFGFVGSSLWSHVNDMECVGDYMYCAMCQGLMVLDISDPANPTLVSRLYLPVDQKDCISVSGDYAYLTGWQSGVTIVDISDPFAPVIAATFPVTYAEGAKVIGDYLYLNYGGFLRIVDISDPEFPHYYTDHDPFEYNSIESIEVFGNQAYLTAIGSVTILDVTDPAHPEQIGSFERTGAFSNRIAKSGDFVFFPERAVGHQELQIFNVADPSAVFEVAKFSFESNAWDVIVLNNLAYVGTEAEGLTVLDVSDPENPTRIYANASMGPIRELEIVGDHFFATGVFDDIRSFDLSVTPNQPSQIGQFDFSTKYIQRLRVRDNIAYIAAHDFVIQDVTDPANPVVLASIPMTKKVADILLDGDIAYVLDQQTGAIAYDISDPANPVRLAGNNGAYGGVTFDKRGDYLYIGTGGSKIYSLNTAQRGLLTMVGELRLSGGSSNDITIRGNLAYIAYDNLGLVIVDITNPASMTVVGSLLLPQAANAVEIVGDQAVVLSKGAELYIIDISNPADPELITTYYDNLLNVTRLWPFEMFAAASLLYIPGAEYTTLVLDISDPANPVAVGHYDPPGLTSGVTIDNDIVYLADYYGLVALDLNLSLPCTLPGDINHDAATNLGDPIFLINFMFKGGPCPPSESASDVNGDCDINVGDAVYMINYIFKGGEPPACSDCM